MTSDEQAPTLDQAPSRSSFAKRPSIEDTGEIWINLIMDNTGLDREEFQEARRLFDLRDQEGDGELDTAEIDLLFRQMKVWMSVRQLWALIQEVDSDCSGTIEMDEFCMMLAKLKGKRPLSHEYFVRQIPRKDRQNFEGVFALLDTDSDAMLTRDEVRAGLKRLGIHVKDANDFERVFNEIDLDGSGTVELDEFLVMMSKLRRPKPEIESAMYSFTDGEKTRFEQIFRTFDGDGQGSMGLSELHQMFLQLGFCFALEQTKAMLNEVDVDNTGEIELGEFFFLLVKLGLGSAVTLRNILGPGATYEEAFRRNVPLDDLWDLGYDDLSRLREAGWSAESLHKAGLGDIQDFRRAGFSAHSLRACGWSAQELKLAGYAMGDLRNAGFSTGVLRSCCQQLENQKVDINAMLSHAAVSESTLPLKPRTPPVGNKKQVVDPTLRWWATPRIKSLIDEFL